MGASPSLSDILYARHSISDAGLGENDLMINFKYDKNGFMFLIENKVDANFQEDQSGRYKARCQKYIKDGKCDECKTVLFAPERYIVDNAGFDYAIKYEDIKEEFFKKQIDSEKRCLYKSELLDIAIEKLRRGYQPIKDVPTSNFWVDYFNLANRIALKLKMPKPKEAIPWKSSFIRFNPDNLPEGVGLFHKYAHGHVDLQLNGMGKKADALNKKYKKHLGDLKFERIGRNKRTAVLRVKIDPIKKPYDFATQQHIAEKGIRTAAQLYDWAQTYLKP